MVIEGVSVRLAGTAQSEIIKVLGKTVGTPVGGNTATPSNLNLGSGKTATGTFQTANEITGLSGGSRIT